MWRGDLFAISDGLVVLCNVAYKDINNDNTLITMIIH